MSVMSQLRRAGGPGGESLMQARMKNPAMVLPHAMDGDSEPV
jgi:hypothetical protein